MRIIQVIPSLALVLPQCFLTCEAQDLSGIKTELSKMNEETTIKGHWWLSEKPEKQLVGEITYGPTNGAKLSVLGHFLHEDFPSFKDATSVHFTVCGITAGGKLVSLFACRITNSNRNLHGLGGTEISSSFGVVGGHFDSPSQMKFAKVTAELTHLHDWAWMSGIKMARKGSGNGWQVTQEIPPDVPIGSFGNFTLSLKFSGQITPGYGDWKLTEECVLSVEAQTITTYESFLDLIFKFQSFVALGVSRPVYPISLKARLDKPEQIAEGLSVYEEFEIIQDITVSVKSKERLKPHEMQFCLEDLKPDKTKFIKRFFDKHQLLEPVCSLYFSALYKPDMYVNQRFLALAHAIEAYHRAFVGGKYQSNEDYRDGLQKVLWDAIPQDIDRDFRASLKNKLRYLHEFSLRKRLQDIYGTFSAVLQPFLGELTQFAGAVADERNLLTHPDSTAEEPPPKTDWTGVWLKAEQLSLLLEVCLLNEIGFDEQAISALLPRNRRAIAIQLNRK